MDVGEYGFGSLASKLAAGVDCPAGARMLSATLPGRTGEPFAAPDVMCAFERNSTVPQWRRHEIVTGSHEARQDVEFVLRTIPTVGNYDYIYDWVFTSKGEIRIEVGATGIVAAKGVAATTAGELTGSDHGTLVAPNLVAPYHDHFLSFRLDLDVDGIANRFVGENLVAVELPKSAGRRSIWTRQARIEPVEFSVSDSHAPQIWRIENPAIKTALGYSPSFEIVSGHNATSLLASEDWPQRRAAFSGRPLWVTAYKANEIYSAGDYPNQGAGGEGLPRFVNRENIADRDLVVWYTMGFHHVTRPEDWPVLPTMQHKVVLRPHRFFDRNPAISLSPDATAPSPAREAPSSRREPRS
jgi:primary-amine oxidase